MYPDERVNDTPNGTKIKQPLVAACRRLSLRYPSPNGVLNAANIFISYFRQATHVMADAITSRVAGTSAKCVSMGSPPRRE